MSSENKPRDLDIGALLKIALDEKPSEGFTERVMEQLAGAQTAVELGRLLSVSPFSWLRPEDENTDAEGDDDDD